MTTTADPQGRTPLPGAGERSHPRDPLHGVTLEALLTCMLARHGWPGLAARIPIRCFQFEPSMKSSLKFLRRTPWARLKLEAWYIDGGGDS